MRQRYLLPFLLLQLLLPACNDAQSGGWESVESLPPGTNISVHTRRRFPCKLFDVTTEEIRCSPDLLPGQQPNRMFTFPRERVQQIHVEKTASNMAIGVALGIAAGAATGVAVCESGKCTSERLGMGELLMGGLFGAIGGIIGTHVPFVHGKVIYRK
jgi:hypothetical protein